MQKIIILFTFAVVSITGCTGDSGRPSDLPPLYPCAVVITQDGSPLAGATVSLMSPDGAKAKYQPSAVTDISGKATFSTYGFNGVPVGRYKVCVRKTLIEDVIQSVDDYGETVNTAGSEYRTVDPEYSEADTTPHEIEVTSKKVPPYSFDVGKAVKIKK
jgi:hypothetical protein